MPKYAVLIDAGFIKRKLGSHAEPLTADTVDRFVRALSVHPALANANLHRVYFYDAPPLEYKITKPLQGGVVDFGKSALARANKSLHSHLARMPFVSLRFGDLRFRGWRLNQTTLSETDHNKKITASDLAPNIQQKGAYSGPN